jgi:hypothetical protein
MKMGKNIFSEFEWDNWPETPVETPVETLTLS